jgi:hypothetical protein
MFSKGLSIDNKADEQNFQHYFAQAYKKRRLNNESSRSWTPCIYSVHLINGLYVFRNCVKWIR